MRATRKIETVEAEVELSPLIYLANPAPGARGHEAYRDYLGLFLPRVERLVSEPLPEGVSSFGEDVGFDPDDLTVTVNIGVKVFDGTELERVAKLVGTIDFESEDPAIQKMSELTDWQLNSAFRELVVEIFRKENIGIKIGSVNWQSVPLANDG